MMLPIYSESSGCVPRYVWLLLPWWDSMSIPDSWVITWAILWTAFVLPRPCNEATTQSHSEQSDAPGGLTTELILAVQPDEPGLSRQVLHGDHTSGSHMKPSRGVRSECLRLHFMVRWASTQEGSTHNVADQAASCLSHQRMGSKH